MGKGQVKNPFKATKQYYAKVAYAKYHRVENTAQSIDLILKRTSPTICKTRYSRGYKKNHVVK